MKNNIYEKGVCFFSEQGEAVSKEACDKKEPLGLKSLEAMPLENMPLENRGPTLILTPTPNGDCHPVVDYDVH